MNHQPSAKPGPSSASASNNGRSAAECGNCGSPKRWILHHVRIRGIHRRVCTSCVLRLHPSSFCPICFQYYDSANVPPSSKRITCSKCSSFTHPQCAPPNVAAAAAGAGTVTVGPLTSSSANSYLCPPCASPNFSFFDLDSDPVRAIDHKRAVVLLCAAKISLGSMNRAVIAARAEAERRVREAALARKRAREALENLSHLVGSKGDKAIRKDGAIASVEGLISEVSGSANSALKLLKDKSFSPSPTPTPPAAASSGLPNSQGKQQMFNGFSATRQSQAAVVASSAGAKRAENGEAEAANGNVNGKDKAGTADGKKEKGEIETKSHGRAEDTSPK